MASPTHHRDSRRPINRRAMGRLALISLLTIVWVYVIPGFVAARDGVFFEQDIRKKLSGQADSQLRTFEGTRDRNLAILRDIDTRIGNGNAGSDLGALVASRDRYAAILQSSKPPVSINPFLGNFTNEVFVLHYGAMALLIWILCDHSFPRKRVWADSLPYATVIYIVFSWPNWLRNFEYDTFEKGRVVYSYVHYDFSKLSFALQEARIFVMFVLVAIVWHLVWFDSTRVSRLIEGWNVPSFLALELSRRAIQFQDTFASWRMSSLVLAAAFIPWTYFFWYEILYLHDLRYIVTGILIHLIWLGTWGMLSLPAIAVNRAWAKLKIETLAIACSTDNSQASQVASFFQEVSKSSDLQLMSASVAAATSLIVPLVNVLKH